MFEAVAKRWVVEFPSLLELSNFVLFRKSIENQRFSLSYFDVIVGFLILSWFALWLIYEKCLNLLFRRMYIPMIQRRRLINGLWNCGFFFGSISYLNLSVVPTMTEWPIPTEQGIDPFQLGLILHKSFYVHRAGIEIFYRENRLRGLSDLIFALFFSDFTKTKWRRVVTDLLYYKAMDSLTTEICRVLLSASNNKAAKFVARLVFVAHCLNWMEIAGRVSVCYKRPTLSSPNVSFIKKTYALVKLRNGMAEVNPDIWLRAPNFCNFYNSRYKFFMPFAIFLVNDILARIYVYVLFVPDIMLWNESRISAPRGLYVKIWFLTELTTSIVVKLFGCIATNEKDWLEACLFLPATEEAVQLSKIRKKQKEALKTNRRAANKKSQLWQTLLCVMTLKKKLRRMRARSNIQNESGQATNETNVDRDKEESEEPGMTFDK